MEPLYTSARPKSLPQNTDDMTDVDSLYDVENDPSVTMPTEADLEGQDQPRKTDASEWKPGSHEWFVMCTLSMVSLMVALDATIVVPILPTLAFELNGTANETFWVGTAYLLTSAVFQPFIASVSGLFGRRLMLVLSICCFTLGTLLCAPIAKNMTVLLAGRAVQGIGGGGIITMTQVIFAAMVPLRQRPKYFTLVLAAWGLGTITGPLIGGVFTQKTTWRWCFYFNFPFCAIGLVMALLSVRLEVEEQPLTTKLKRVDWIGAFLFIGGMTSFLVGISWAGTQFAWSSAATLVPICVGLLSVAAAMTYEVRYAKEPFIRYSLFSSRSALAAYFAAFAQGFSLLSVLYYITFYFTAAKFHGPIRSGVDLLPVTLFFIPSSVIVGRLTARLGRFRWAVWTGWAVSSVGSGLFLLLNEQTPTAVWAVSLAVFGVGMGMTITAVNVAIQAISKAEDCGHAAAIYAFVRSLGMSIGVAVGGTAFQNVMARRLGELGLPTAIAHNAEAFVHELTALSPTDPVRVRAIDAYVKGFHAVFYVMLALALTTFVFTLAIGKHSMDKPLETDFVLKRQSVLETIQAKRDSARQSFLGALQSKPGHSSLTLSPESISYKGVPQLDTEVGGIVEGAIREYGAYRT